MEMNVVTLNKVFSSTSHRFSAGLRSGLWLLINCQACIMHTSHDGCITSSASPLTLMRALPLKSALYAP